VSQPPLVLIPDRLSPPPDVEQEVLGDGVEVVVCSARNAAEISDDTWARADAVLAWHDLRFTPHVLSKLKRCRVLVRVGVGVDNVDLRAAGERGIIVCNVPDYATADVADHAMALMLALSRGLLAFSEQVRGAPAHWRWETAGAPAGGIDPRHHRARPHRDRDGAAGQGL
jgi:lactate dehydrogenase-like 2-hydroxyacid dehydrogenase